MQRRHSTGALTAQDHSRQNAVYREHGRHYRNLFIGTGMACLTDAALLANAGEEVCMLEFHDRPGGYAHTFGMNGYNFCAQVHYIWDCGPGGYINSFLTKIGLEQEITFELLDKNGYDRMVMPDNTTVFIPFGFEKLAQNIEVACPGQGENVRRFTNIIQRIRDEVRLLPDRQIRPWEYITKGWKFRTLWWYQNKTLQDVFDECCLSRQVQAVLIAQAGDFMAPPRELSIFAYAGLFGGYNTGAYYPTKHFGHFIKTIADFITSHEGCHIYYENQVTKINVSGGKVVSVETEDGKIFTADRYICGMDPRLASYLVGRNNFPTEYFGKLDYEYSHSGFMVYLGLQGIDLREYGFGNFNTWIMNNWDMDEAWRAQMSGDFKEPWVFIGTPTLHSSEPGIAPEGGQIMEIETLANFQQFRKLKRRNPREYERLKQKLRDQLIDFVATKYVPNLRKHIRVRPCGSPSTNRDFCLAPMGNAYGSHLTPRNMGLGRLKPETPFPNLRWCNASSGYGGIAPTCGTGVREYMHQTGDMFYRIEDKPSDEELVKIARGEK